MDNNPAASLGVASFLVDPAFGLASLEVAFVGPVVLQPVAFVDPAVVVALVEFVVQGQFVVVALVARRAPYLLFEDFVVDLP